MRRALALVLAVAGCAAAQPPAPKAPDESRRVPVNRVAPPETEGASGSGPVKRKSKVEWR